MLPEIAPFVNATILSAEVTVFSTVMEPYKSF